MICHSKFLELLVYAAFLQNKLITDSDIINETSYMIKLPKTKLYGGRSSNTAKLFR